MEVFSEKVHLHPAAISPAVAMQGMGDALWMKCFTWALLCAGHWQRAPCVWEGRGREHCPARHPAVLLAWGTTSPQVQPVEGTG